MEILAWGGNTLSLRLFRGIENCSGLLDFGDPGVAGLEFSSIQILFWDPSMALIIALNTFQHW